MVFIKGLQFKVRAAGEELAELSSDPNHVGANPANEVICYIEASPNKQFSLHVEMPFKVLSFQACGVEITVDGHVLPGGRYVVEFKKPLNLSGRIYDDVHGSSYIQKFEFAEIQTSEHLTSVLEHTSLI